MSRGHVIRWQLLAANIQQLSASFTWGSLSGYHGNGRGTHQDLLLAWSQMPSRLINERFQQLLYVRAPPAPQTCEVASDSCACGSTGRRQRPRSRPDNNPTHTDAKREVFCFQLRSTRTSQPEGPFETSTAAQKVSARARARAPDRSQEERGQQEGENVSPSFSPPTPDMFEHLFVLCGWTHPEDTRPSSPVFSGNRRSVNLTSDA